MINRLAAILAFVLLAFPATSQAQDVQILTELSRTPVEQPQGRSGAPVGGGRDLIVAIYYMPALKTTFAGCLLSNPGTSGYEILPPFRRWYADAPTDTVERSLSLEGVLAADGGLPKFVRRLTAHGDECFMDASGFTTSNTPAATTTVQLGAALRSWHQQPVDGWSSLYLFWPSPTKPAL